MADAELDERFDVCLHRAREAPDLGAEASVRDQPDRARVVLGHTRESGLDPLDPEPVEQPCDLELVLGRKHDAHRLLAVAQRRVVEADRPARLRLERALVQGARVQLVARDRHARTMPSGNGQSFSGAPSVISQLSSTRRPPPPSQ